MSFESLLSTVQRLQTSAEALAALGAELRLRREGLQADPNIVARLHDVLRALDPTLVNGLSAEQEEMALVMIQSGLGQTFDLISDPARAPGWSHVNPEILQGQGLGSRRFVRAINTLAAQRADLQRVLAEPGAFLDVGTGVGWLAIEAARAWPALRCVGIDVWEPALRLARANLAGAAMEDRVELRTQAVEDLKESEVYALAWLPPFIPVSVIPTALQNIHNALIPGGWLVMCTLGAPPDPLSKTLAALKLARIGSYSWSASEIEDRLRQFSFEQVETFSHTPTTVIIVGRKALP
jgi:predicted O-methyltransferase YrrM